MSDERPRRSVMQQRMDARSSFDLEAVELPLPLGKAMRVYRGPMVAFIPHPNIHGAWVRVHPCVTEVACPHCGAGVGELCHSTIAGRRTVTNHYKRAWAAQEALRA